MTKYISGSGFRYDELEMIERLKKRINEEDGELKILLGADSKIVEDGVLFATVIALHIVGSGGIFFVRKDKVDRFMSLPERLFYETSLSVEEAQKLDRYGILDSVDLIEVHCDAGNNGKSRDYISAMKGMVEGFGFKGYIKPEAMAASNIADRYTK